MKKQSKLDAILAQVKGNQKTRRIAAVLACLVVLGTLWRLTLPAITLEWGKPQAEGISEPEMEETLQEEELLTEESLSEEEEEAPLSWPTLEEAAAAGYPDAVRVDRLICGQRESEGHTHTADCIESYYTAQTASFAEEAFLAMPAQRFEGEAGNLSVRIDAAEGTFPETTEMALEEVDTEEVRRAASGLVNGKISQVLAVDIGFLYEGEKIEPEQPVQVVLSGSALEGMENPVVLHIDGEGNAEIVSHRTAEEPASAPRLMRAAPMARTGAAELTEETIEENNESTEENTEGVPEGAEAADEAAGEAADDIPKGALVFEAEEFSAYAVLNVLETTYITADGETYVITVAYDDEAGIPEGAALEVREILPETEEYAGYLAASAEKLGVENGEVSFARFFDITILADGAAIQPKTPVQLTIELAEELTEDVQAVHFQNDPADEANAETVLMEATLSEPQKLSSAVSMDAEGFSVYGVVKVPAPATVNDLAGYSVKISNQGYYLGAENITVNENSRRLSKTNVEADAPVWTFESAGANGQYYISTTTDEGKQYINISRSTDNPTERGDVVLSDEPQALTVTRNGSHYRISGTDNGTYYINQFGGTGGTGFAGWWYNGAGEAQLDFTFTPPLVDTGEKDYMVVVKQGDRYYVVMNDGTLSPAEYNPDDNTVAVDDPMMWKYDGSRLYHVTREAGFTDFDTASSSYYRYIDPNSETGLNEDDETNTVRRGTSGVNQDGINGVVIDSRNLWDNVKFNYTDGHKLQSTSNPDYYIGAENGKLKGQASENEAVEVFLADPVVQSHNWTRHSVNHIDISIAGSAEVDVPLAYGKYYDKNGELVKDIPRNRFEKLHLTAAQVVKEDPNEDPLAITPADMKRARITASCNGEELDNAFYITGYNGNAQHEGSSGQEGDPGYVTSPQIRIDGSFLVAKMPEIHATINPGLYDSIYQYRKDIRDEHLANKVEYSVSVVKTVEYYLQIPVLDGNGDPVLDGSGNPTYQQLYDAEGNKIKVKANLTFSDSFTYWDSENECPVFTDGEKWYYYKNYGPQTNDWKVENWEAGDIARCDFSGMDFKLGGRDSTGVASANCIEIIKMVVDEDGNPIKSGEISDASFSIYRKGVTTDSTVVGSDGTTYLNVVHAADDTVKDLNVGSFTAAPDYTGYTFLRDKSAQIGDEGVGIVHDYNVTPALYYVKEDPDSIDEKITDNEGTLWNYKDTYILTEYAWRNNAEKDGSMHYSDTFTKSSTGAGAYSSAPEILGNHYGYDGTSGPYTNDFLEFYVYNVYREIETVDVPVDKTWPDVDNTYTWSSTFELEELEVLEEGPANPNANTTVWRKVEGVDPLTISKGDTGDAITFKNLPKYRYYANEDGTFSKYRIMYSVDETAYELKNNSNTTISKWDKNGGLTDGDEIYAPQWPHDAGDLDDEMHLTEEDENFYHVIVENYKSDTNVIELLDKVTLRKVWGENVLSDAGVNENDAYATFQLKRIATTQFIEYDGYEDVDCTVNLIGKDGQLDSITVKKGAKLKINATFDTSSGSGYASFMFNNSGSDNLSVSWYSGDNHVSSNAFTVTGDMTISPTVGQYYSPEWKGKLESASLVPYSSQGITVGEDTNFSAEKYTYTVNRAGGWQEIIKNLPLKSASAVNNGRQTISTYSYYFVEIDSNPKGVYVEMTDGHGNPLGDAAHPISEDNKTAVGENKPIPEFWVNKEWHDIKDPDNYPEIRFTLYQGLKGNDGKVQAGSVFVGSNGESYVDIPLNSDNNWSWKCPGYLPDKDEQGRDVGYYVVEKTTGLKACIYKNSTLDGAGNVVEYGDEITDRFNGDEDIAPWDYYSSDCQSTDPHSAGHGFTGASGQLPIAQNGGIAKNEGTLYIVNRAAQYIQFDVKKKWLEWGDDGSLMTTTSYPHRLRETCLKYILMRRTVEVGHSIDDYLEDWEDYGKPFYVGWDDNNPANHFVVDPNNYGLVHQSEWFWQVNDSGQDYGLPAHGYYEKEDGTVVKVNYYYITRELGVYKNTSEEPLKEGYDWYVALLPQAWGPKGETRPIVFDMAVAQDQDRILNVQASDLEVDKDWTETPDNVEEVYVKIWRQANGAIEDFTKDIAKRTDELATYGFVDDPTRLTMLDNGTLVLGLTPQTGGVLIHNVLMAPSDSGNLNTNYYQYWIEEVGYKDKDGNVYFTNGTNSATSTFFAQYDHSDSQGNWTESWTESPTGNKIKLSTKGKNKLRVKNEPTKDVEVKKEWYDENGNKLTGPWNKAGTTEPVATSISFKVKRSDGQYLTFGGQEETLTIQTSGQRAVVRTATKDSTAYTVTYVPDSTDKADIGNWTTLVHGLQKYASDGTEYTYTVEEVRNQDGKVVDSSGNVIENCTTSVTGSGASFIIKNEKEDTSLAIEKTFDGGVTLTDEQKQKITFTVTGKFDGTNEETRTFTYGKDGLTVEGAQDQTDVYKWNNGVLVIHGIKPGEYTVTEQNDGVDSVLAEDTSGKIYTHTVNIAVTPTDAAKPKEPADDYATGAKVTEDQRTTVSFTNTYDEASKGALKIQKAVKVNDDAPTADQYSYVDGEYTFTVTGPTTAAAADQVTKYVKIKVQNGQMVSYQIADADTEAAWTAAATVNGVWALVKELEAGDYTITEAATDGMTVSSITGGKNDADTGARRITVQVTAGDTTAEEATAQATFTNNRSLIEIKILKVDANKRQEYLSGAVFKVYKKNASSVYEVFTDSQLTEGQFTISDKDNGMKLSLPAGEYKIEEVSPPSGYVKTDGSTFYFTISGETVTYTDDKGTQITDDSAMLVRYTSADTTFTVGNEPGAALPSTGGPGTRAITLAGLALTLLALAGIVQKRKG